MGTHGTRRFIVLLTVVLATGLWVASIARADILATVEVPGFRPSDTDLATFDVATGARSDPGVNTDQFEFHPSIAHNRLVFQRVQDNENEIIMKDLGTGQQADLFNGLGTRFPHPNDPALAPDGSIVLTGGQASTVCCTSEVTSTDVSAFPNGPFPHTQVPGDTVPGEDGQFTGDPVVVGTNPLSFIFTEPQAVFNGNDELHARLPTLVGRVATHATHGTAAAGGKLIVYQDLSNPSALRAIDTANHTPPERLPPPVNAGRTEPGRTGGGTVAIEPSLSSDGRYLAFVRWRTVDDDRRLFVWDSQTQLLVNPDGIELGKLPGWGDTLGRDGNIALTISPVLQTATIRPTVSTLRVLINFRLLSASNIGIIVQKVIGRTRLFGKPAPKLRLLGRVPLGQFKRGKDHIVWNRTLGSRKLAPGLYQVTVRSLTATGGVRDLSHPVLIRIK